MNDPVFRDDVFLSHSARDKAVARPLAERLRADGVDFKSPRQKAKVQLQPSAFILQPFSGPPIKGSQAQFLYINWRPENREQQGLNARKAIAQAKPVWRQWNTHRDMPSSPAADTSKIDVRSSPDTFIS